MICSHLFLIAYICNFARLLNVKKIDGFIDCEICEQTLGTINELKKCCLFNVEAITYERKRGNFPRITIKNKDVHNTPKILDSSSDPRNSTQFIVPVIAINPITREVPTTIVSNDSRLRHLFATFDPNENSNHSPQSHSSEIINELMNQNIVSPSPSMVVDFDTDLFA